MLDQLESAERSPFTNRSTCPSDMPLWRTIKVGTSEGTRGNVDTHRELPGERKELGGPIQEREHGDGLRDELPFRSTSRGLWDFGLNASTKLANQATTNLKHVREIELSKRNRLRRRASYRVGDLGLVHHLRFHSCPRNCLQDPYFGPCRIIKIDGSRIHERCSPRLGRELLCARKQRGHYHSPEDLHWDESRLSDKEVKRIDLENAASPKQGDKLEGIYWLLQSHEAGQLAHRGSWVHVIFRGELMDA